VRWLAKRFQRLLPLVGKVPPQMLVALEVQLFHDDFALTPDLCALFP